MGDTRTTNEGGQTQDQNLVPRQVYEVSGALIIPVSRI